MDVITPETPQVTADSDYISDESYADFSQALDQLQMQTEQTTHQDEPVQNPSPPQPDQDEPVTESPLGPEEQITITPNEPSDNIIVEQPKNQVSELGTQNTETQNDRKALENTQHLPEKENFQQMVDKIPNWSNSILLAHAGIERQASPGKTLSLQQSGVNAENTENNSQAVSSEQESTIETNVETNIKIDTSLLTETSANDNAEIIASGGGSQSVELISASIQTGQNQTQTAAQVIIDDNEQTQQIPYQPEQISVIVEPKATAQEGQQPTIENNVIDISTNQPVSGQVTQDSQSNIQQSIQTSQLDETVNSQPLTEQSISDNKSGNLPNQTQQTPDSNFTVDSLVNKAEGEQLQITNVQTTTSNTQTLETNIDTASQQIVNTGSEQNQGIELSTPTQTENPDAGVLLNAASAKVGQQIQESMQSSFGSGQQQITISLQPPELGKVTIKFEQQGDDITGQLEVTKTETRSQITEQLPEIIRNLTDAGIQIKKIEVNLANQYQQDGYKEQSSQDMFASNQGTLGQQYDSQQQSDTAELFQEPTEPDQLYQNDFDTQPQMLDTEGSLNILV
jgi:flagellar hook-length control protein FliK